MKFTLAFCVLILLCVTSSNAQIVSVSDLKNTIVAKHSINPDTVDFCDFVVVDGMPYTLADIESGKEVIAKGKLRDTFMFANVSQVVHSKTCDWLLITGSGLNQKSKEKKALVDKLRESMKPVPSETITIADEKCGDCMAIVVDGKALDEQESIQFVSNLKARNIAHIAFYKNANPDFYGYRAKNGMMEIFIKN